MKKRIGLIVAAVFFLCLIVICQRAGGELEKGIKQSRETAGTLQQNKNLVVLDPGHGGKDPGKVGVNGVGEKEVNLKIALYIEECLKQESVDVVMTRTEDERLAGSQAEDLKARVDLVNKNAPALAVSIHQNSYHQESVRGAQVFYHSDSAEGEKAASAIQEKLAELDQNNAKHIKANNTYYLLKNTAFPTVIAECGFMSNYEEAELLTQEDYQKELARAVSEGIMQYITAL